MRKILLSSQNKCDITIFSTFVNKFQIKHSESQESEVTYLILQINSTIINLKKEFEYKWKRGQRTRKRLVFRRAGGARASPGECRH